MKLKLFNRDLNKLRRPVHFFEYIAHSLVVSIVGLLFTLFLIFVTLSTLFFKPIYNQMIIFSFIGVVTFLVSYKLFLRYHGYVLRNLTYENFIIAKKRLFFWFTWTVSTYLILCWFILLLLGACHGFNLTFPTSDSKSALLVYSAYETKVLGIILLTVHVFILIIFKLVIYYWSRIFAFAYKEFEKRKKMLEIVRTKATIK